MDREGGGRRFKWEKEETVNRVCRNGLVFEIGGCRRSRRLYGPMELCLYFNEGAMLIPLAARSRCSPPLPPLAGSREKENPFFHFAAAANGSRR